LVITNITGSANRYHDVYVGRDVAGTSADNAAADPPAERAEDEAAPSANERAGRGLGCNTAELLALCSSDLTIDRDSVRSTGVIE
jgi:hypothetical protein